MSAPSFGDKVAILLCTRNGARFLQQQLDSYATQTHANWILWASDDGSTDATREILEQQRQALGTDKLVILSGPGQGGPAHFLSLASRHDLAADYFAFSDQDDIWEPEKLARAVRWLQTIPPDTPALYCGRTRYIDEQGRELGLSPLNQRPPGLANALVQNIAGGNTMVFNQAARELINSLPPVVPVVVHDWWAYQVITACGGRVYFAPQPDVRYRQHSANLIGANAGWRSRLRRAGESLRGSTRRWNDTQLTALATVEPRMTQASARIFAAFVLARQQWLVPRIAGIWRSGVHRQTRCQQLWFWVQVLVNRV